MLDICNVRKQAANAPIPLLNVIPPPMLPLRQQMGPQKGREGLVRCMLKLELLTLTQIPRDRVSLVAFLLVAVLLVVILLVVVLHNLT